MWFLHIDSLRPQLVDGLKVCGEHVWMLAIFDEYVLLHRCRDREVVTPAKRYEEDVSDHTSQVSRGFPWIARILTTPWLSFVEDLI